MSVELEKKVEGAGCLIGGVILVVGAVFFVVATVVSPTLVRIADALDRAYPVAEIVEVRNGDDDA